MKELSQIINPITNEIIIFIMVWFNLIPNKIGEMTIANVFYKIPSRR